MGTAVMMAVVRFGGGGDSGVGDGGCGDGDGGGGEVASGSNDTGGKAGCNAWGMHPWRRSAGGSDGATAV